MMNSQHPGNGGGGASLYDKLNNVHASLRKQKEDAYRTKQLAEERLRLARQDREAMERKGNETKVQLRQLKEGALKMKGENEAMEKENRQMEKEFNFQHSELQSKKEKLSRLEEKRAAEASGRHRSASAAREMLRRLREDSSRKNAGSPSPGGRGKNGRNSEDDPSASLSPRTKRRKLEQVTEVDGGEELCGRLPELVKMRRAREREGIQGLERRNASLRRIVAGYQNALGHAGATEFPQRQEGGNEAVLRQ